MYICALHNVDSLCVTSLTLFMYCFLSFVLLAAFLDFLRLYACVCVKQRRILCARARASFSKQKYYSYRVMYINVVSLYLICVKALQLLSSLHLMWLSNIFHFD